MTRLTRPTDLAQGLDHKTMQAYIARGHVLRAQETRRLFGALSSWITGRARAAGEGTIEAAAGRERAACH